ncbi:MAG: hypothetical protein M1818_005170 [Claussenomyces sp. TS43310]|nr:MAG: hypothetical protein M1818_005170 [Claussenomyces sp. TS43310]
MAAVTVSSKSESFRDLPRSPASISPRSARRDSLLLSEQRSGPRTPTSPPMRLTRKRAASLNTEAANHPHLDNLALNSAGVVNPRATAAREQVCLCQPDPKIPRPRNAFILYRQHYQAQVVAQHPGLANPEISKIIGEQWRDQPVEVKSEWKRLAEEEKQRHQRQYPDYRYQPRRAGKANGGRLIASSSGEDPVRCPKCNGRYISTPSTPLTPFTPSFGVRTPRLLPPFTAPHTPPREDHSRYPETSIHTPQTPPNHNQMHRRQQFSGPATVGMPNTPREDEIDLISPDVKRRRFNEGSHVYPPASLYGPPQLMGRPPPMSAVGYPGRQPLPGPGHIVPNHQGSMEPPPRPSPISQQYPGRVNPFDESLRLPPLQTQLQKTGPSWPDTQQRESQARSVEAMVMTIPYLNKIRVLSKISPPLAPPGPGSPLQEIRGPAIAIEGVDPNSVSEVGRFLEDYLNKEQECAVRTWMASLSNESKRENDVPADVDMSGMANSTTISATSSDRFVAYLDEIHAWHQKSVEIVKFITTPPPVSSASSSSTSPSAVPAHPLSPANTSVASSVSASVSGKPRIPVALMPMGFSLSVSDHHASLIPINDAYAPVDHWQWTATLWRGIVGPDLTIYVKVVGIDMEEREEMVRNGGVDIKGEYGAIVVRMERSNGNGGMEEKTLRRLGFEVLEFVRSFGTSGEDGRGQFARS